MTRRYLSRAEVARRIGVAPDTLGRYRLPEADAAIGNTRGWLESTIDAWNTSRPGRGARTDIPVALWHWSQGVKLSELQKKIITAVVARMDASKDPDGKPMAASGCPMCHHQRMDAQDSQYALLAFDGQPIDGQPVVAERFQPVVALICENCGYVALHSSIKLGLVNKSP